MRGIAFLCVVFLAGCPGRGSGAIGNTGPAGTAPTTTVVMVDLHSQAMPIACFAPGRGVIGDGTACDALIAGDRAVATPRGHTRTVGARVPYDCAGEESTALALTGARASEGLADAPDPVEEILVWPPARAAAVIAWRKGGTPAADVVARYQEIAAAEGEAESEQAAAHPAAIPAPALIGTLTADLDGDGVADDVLTLHPPGAGDVGGEVEGTRLILARVSSRGGALVPLLRTGFENAMAFAALDVDSDGRVEIFYALPYYEGDSISLGRYTGAALEHVGGWGCGL
jgi:hypothetical protein